MDYYHGSIIPHLTELHPFEGKENNLKKPCVYLTTNPQLAIHYIRDKSRLWISPTLDVREDGVLVYQEMFSNALEYMYKGVSGYVYRVSGDYGINTVPGVRFAAVSDEPVPIIDGATIKSSNVSELEQNEVLAIVGVTVHTLPKGYGYDINNKEVKRLKG